MRLFNRAESIKRMNHDHVVNMSREDLVKQGYLVIVRQGNKIEFQPTDKYRYTMMHPTLPSMVVYTEIGSYTIDDRQTICYEP